MPLLQVPGMISLGGGLPNPETFPFKSLTVQLKDGSEYAISGKGLDAALQYSPTNGLPSFLAHLETLRLHYHTLPGGEGGALGDHGVPRSSMVSTGSQDALSKAFEMLLAPGDSLLLESPTYSGSLAFLRPLGVYLAGVETDGGGMDPLRLEEMLESWKDNQAPGEPPFPRVLYTIPNGSNPTGGSLSEERRRRIYALCARYDILILEDDPYYFLQFGDGGASRSSCSSSSSGDGLAPSFMAMDMDGRVLRFDSMSKVLAAGLRLGWATGPAPLIDRLQLHMQSTSLHASGLAQSVVAGLFDSWAAATDSSGGGEGMIEAWEEHVAGITSLYRRRRDFFLGCCERHLGADNAANGGEALAEWTAPAAGMFCWLKLKGIPNDDSLGLVKVKAVDAKVLFVPGVEFMPSNHRKPVGQSPVCPFVRASFSTATEADMEEAVRRLAAVVREARAEAEAADAAAACCVSSREEAERRERGGFDV
jgi:kynurenine/2-aminoadipate aminotransferase